MTTRRTAACQASRFSAVSRRAFLGGASAVTVLGLAACGDDSALSPSSSTGSATSSSTSSATSSDAATSSSTSTESSSATGDAATGSLEVSFTISGSSSGGGPGGARNPYVAVWVEDADGALVQTLALWHLSGGNDRWLADLRAWYEASGGTETNSGATRADGSYTVGWDLTDSSGATVTAGEYTLSIEGAREHGSYELVQQSVTIGGDAAEGQLEASNDLTAASWKYTP